METKKMCSFRLSGYVCEELKKLTEESKFSQAEIIEILVLSYITDCPYSLDTLYQYTIPRRGSADQTSRV